MSSTLKATQLVLVKKGYQLIFLLSFLGLIFSLIYIPVRVIPGNDLSFQLSLLKNTDWILLVLISLLTSLLITFNIFTLSQKKRLYLKRRGAGLILGPIGGLLGTLSCVACALSVLGLVSLGTLVFITQYRVFLSLISIIIVLISLYYTSELVLDICDRCKV